MNQKAVEYQKTVEVMTWLLDLDTETERKVSTYMQSMGIKTFFLNLESFDLPIEVLIKLQDLRAVIEAFDGDIADLDLDGEGGMRNE